MTTNNQSFIEEKFPPVRIFWEDALALKEVFKEQFEGCNIVADDEKYDSLDKLLEKYDAPFTMKIRIKKLIFKSIEPYFFKLEMLKDRTTFSSAVDDGKSREILEMMKGILKNHTIRDSMFNRPPFQKLAPVAIGVMFILAVLFRKDDIFALLFSFLGFAIAGVLYCFGHEYNKPVLSAIIKPDDD